MPKSDVKNGQSKIMSKSDVQKVLGASKKLYINSTGRLNK